VCEVAVSKPFKLKRWLTLAESSSHLSTAFNAPVAVADVLRLGLDGRLTLSVIFPIGVLGAPLEPVSEDEVIYDNVSFGDGKGRWKLSTGEDVFLGQAGQVLRCKSAISCLQDDWPYDLPMMGSERTYIERKYFFITGGPLVEFENPYGAFVSDGRRFFQVRDALSDRAGMHPVGGLPKDSMIVVRTEELLALQWSARPPSRETQETKEISFRGPSTFLNIIGALVELIQATRPGRNSRADVIREMVENYGEKPGISKPELEDTFAEADRALRNS
jgi:hypothetical protein